MKESLSYIEVNALVRELKNLSGAKVENIYHPTKDELVINLYSGQKVILLIKLPNFVTLTQFKRENPQMPSHFCMFLRKYLTNARIVGVSQPGAERVIEFEFKKADQKYFLIVELFSEGNIIICDKDKKILVPLHAQTWKDRIVRAKQQYSLPPKNFDAENFDFAVFKQVIMDAERNQIVKSLAVALGLGGTYAEEVCMRAGIPKDKNPKELTDDELRLVFNAFNMILEKSREETLSPNIIFENETPVDVQPFELEIYANKKKKLFESYTEAIDSFFTGKTVKKITKSTDDKTLLEIMKQESLLRQHKAYLEELKEKSVLLKKEADWVYQHFQDVQEILETLTSARAKNVPWPEILLAIEKKKAEGNPQARMIKEIYPNEGLLVLDFESGITLDFRNSITENANALYEKSKKMNGKLDGVQKAISDVEAKIEKIKTTEHEPVEKVPVKIERKEKEWFERFHWFYTSDGKLVVAGRDAGQNEILIKKYTDNEDIVFHGDVQGSPFAVMKKGVDSSELDKQETANFTLCHSKAWQNKRIESVYWVKPEQVSKTAPAGEYIARGGFMIYGRKNYIKDVELRLGVGIQVEPLRVVSGPVENLRKRARYYAVLLPGDKTKDAVSKSIKDYLQTVVREEHQEFLKQISIEDIKEHAIEQSKIFGVVD